MKPTASIQQTSTSLSSSFQSPSQLSPAWGVDNLDTDELLEVLTNAKEQTAYWTARVQSCLDRLDILVENSELPEDLNWNDYHIYRQAGKKTYSYPDYITDKEADLKQAKELSIALGEPKIKVGKPFWTVKPI